MKPRVSHVGRYGGDRTAGQNTEGKLACLEGKSEGSTTDQQVISLTPKQFDHRMDEGWGPYCEEEDGPQHECLQPCLFTVIQEDTKSFSDSPGLHPIKEERAHIPIKEERAHIHVKQELVEVLVHAI